ncbi:hypothetical protein [Rhizobium leguminosarum]|uniref:hypothetical protein n=1 Tax=Rhizobium leguminosarum TaxID=384 RepID=UPI003F9A87F5
MMAGKYKRTFIPAVSFTGFPNDVKTHFTAGVESAPMPADFIKLMRAKGLTTDDIAETQADKPEGKPGAGEEG